MSTLGSRLAAGVRCAADGVGTWAARLRPGAAARAPAERSVLDDVAMRRPWNLRIKAARLAARARLSRLQDGVTVVIVNWNTKEILADVIRGVETLSPPGTRILVVDNGSKDGSREMLRRWPGLELVLLRSNAGHGVALDLAVLRVRTTVTVLLDSDAIPLRSGWLEPVVEPVRAGRALLTGLQASRNFVHPSYAAVDTRTFVRSASSFQVHRLPGVTDENVVWGENAWDTGELLSVQLGAAAVCVVPRVEDESLGLPGITAGDVVYHHSGVSRYANGFVSDDAYTEWQRACSVLGLTVTGSTRDAE